jgi:nucleoside-diphosphate-sugar epimerase
MTFISDVAEAIARIATLEGTHVFDIGGPAVTMRDILRTIGRLAGVPPVFEVGNRADDLIADTSMLASLTDFFPSTTIDQGLRSCV